MNTCVNDDAIAHVSNCNVVTKREGDSQRKRYVETQRQPAMESL
jgi:hypothetical protein